MNITICGSMQFESKMTEFKRELEERRHTVFKPNSVEGHAYGVGEDLDENAKLKRGFIDEHFAKIDKSEAILVVNEAKKGVDGYIGGNTLVEIGYAYSQGLDIFLLNPVPDMSYTNEINGMHPVVLDGDIDKLGQYIDSLPLVYMSTESKLKQLATSRAMRRAGIKVRVDGKKVDSGVPEQPMSINETYEGATNRQANLRKLGIEADYYATIESGMHHVHDEHSLFGVNVVVIEPRGGGLKIGIGMEVEIPREMLDMIPSIYPDLGELVKQEYGAKEKDPIPYLTNHHRTKQELTESTAYNVTSQLSMREGK